jgi:hypothetical protein
MLSVFLTIWLLLQLPVTLGLGRFFACPQKPAVKRTEARPSPTAPHARAA